MPLTVETAAPAHRRWVLRDSADAVIRDLLADAIALGDDWAMGALTEASRIVAASIESLDGIAARLDAQL